jgi:hypothetical protein
MKHLPILRSAIGYIKCVVKIERIPFPDAVNRKVLRVPQTHMSKYAIHTDTIFRHLVSQSAIFNQKSISSYC